MTETLYLMRHGETLFNKLNKVQGACDSPLTKKGIEDTKIARKYFIDHKIHFDKIYCSTQERASDTANIITKQPFIRLKGLKEQDCGLLEGEGTYLNPQSWAGYADFYIQFGGESAKQYINRLTKTLKKIMKKAHEEKPNSSVLAVSHGGVMSGFLRNFSPYKNYKKKIRLQNDVILKLNYDRGHFSLTKIINVI